jgi:hypothetical protein
MKIRVLIYGLLSIFAIGVLLEVIFRSVLGVSGGLIANIYVTAERKITSSRQISVMENEEKVRRSSPPTEEQISQMKETEALCFENADCNESPSHFSDCNGPTYNRYYCTQHQCMSTAIGCPSIYFKVCESNKCKKKPLPSIFSR